MGMKWPSLRAGRLFDGVRLSRESRVAFGRKFAGKGGGVGAGVLEGERPGVSDIQVLLLVIVGLDDCKDLCLEVGDGVLRRGRVPDFSRNSLLS